MRRFPIISSYIVTISHIINRSYIVIRSYIFICILRFDFKLFIRNIFLLIFLIRNFLKTVVILILILISNRILHEMSLTIVRILQYIAYTISNLITIQITVFRQIDISSTGLYSICQFIIGRKLRITPPRKIDIGYFLNKVDAVLS